MEPWRLTTLGQYALVRDGRSVAAPATLKARALLVFLALHRHADVGRERLLDLLWPMADPDRARANLKTATWSLRRVLRDAGTDPDESLAVGRATLRWIAPIEIDLESLYAAAAEGADHAAARAAMDRFGGDFLEGDYEEWVVAERERAAGAYEAVLRRLARANDEGAARALIERDPYDEAAFAVAVAAAERRGDRAESRRLRERFAQACRDLGIAASLPPPPLTADTSDRRVIPRVRFAGRERELRVVRDAVAAARGGRGAFVAFVGEAGIGKSAVLDRAREIANGAGLRVIATCGVGDDARAYGPWEALFETLVGGSFARFARAGGAETAQRLAAELCAALRAPSAVFLDDLHAFRGEAASVAIAFATQATRAGHVILAASRPVGSDLVARLVRANEGLSLELGSLGEREVREALAGSRDLDANVAAALFERSGGHPLFLIGLVDVLARHGGPPIDALESATSLRATLEAQLRSRGAFAAALACALALEPTADPPTLAAALEASDAAVADALDDLIALRAVVQPEIGPPFAFAHDVIADVAAQLLPRAARVRLHLAFADAAAADARRGAAVRRAQHLERAGALERAAHVYEVAARGAGMVRPRARGRARRRRDRCPCGARDPVGSRGAPCARGFGLRTRTRTRAGSGIGGQRRERERPRRLRGACRARERR